MFKPLTIPLVKGLNQDQPANAAESDAGLTTATNIDFTLKNSLTGRPGALRATGFSARQLAGTGTFSDVAVASLAATGYAGTSLVVMHDGLAERPGLVTKGRLFTYDTNRWTDRLGILPARVDRVCEFKAVGAPAGVNSNNAYTAGGATLDMGPSNNGVTGVATQTMSLLNDNGSVEARVPTTMAIVGSGNGCRVGNVSTLLVSVTGATHNLKVFIRAKGTRVISEVVLATDAQTPTGTGDAPVVCCDYDETNAYVAYITTTVGVYKVIKFNPATGAVILICTINDFLALRGIWVTNTSVADNRVVVTATLGAGAMMSHVITSTTMVDTGLTLTTAVGGTCAASGQVVCGVAENNSVWMAAVGDLGVLHVMKRSLSAATLTFDRSWQGAVPDALGGAGGANKEGITWFIQHQPIKLGGRVLLGLSTIRSNGISFITAGATWSIWDVTDLWMGSGTASFSLRDPVAVAKGEGYRSMVAWGPMAAVLSYDGNAYRFPSVDWQVLTDGTNTTGGIGRMAGSLLGGSGSLGLNELSLLAPQAASFKDSTIIAGSVPRMACRGYGTPVGFPLLESPTFEAVALAGGGGVIPVGDYTMLAIWSWSDDSGQVHRSPPSTPITITFTAGVQRLQVNIGVPHFNERDTGTVYCDLYITNVNPTSASPHYLRARFEYPGSASLSVGATYLAIPQTVLPLVLYTDGGVFESQLPDASGGVAVVGSRVWVASSRAVYASRLGPTDDLEPPSWYIDGALTKKVPSSAGRVVALATIDDKLVVFCQRGIYVISGQGPDDIGQGPDFTDLQKVSDLGVTSQRSLVATPKGIVFQASNSRADNRKATGGLWVLDRGLSCTQVSSKAQDMLSATTGELTYLPEREQVYFSTGGPILMWDLRSGEWATWEVAESAGDTFANTLCVASGVLWAVGTEPMLFTGTAGADNFTGSPIDFAMQATLGVINVAGDGARWGRVRSMTVIGDWATAYTLDQQVVLDEANQYTANPVAVNAAGVATWPTGRHVPEWRLPSQKCAVISATITATPAVAVWTALQFEVSSNGRRAPSGQRQ